MNKIFIKSLKNAKNFWRALQEKISLRQKIYISKRISFLLEAGISLPDSLYLISGQMKRRKTALSRMASEISRGKSATAVIVGEKIFGKMAFPILKIGEESGMLAQSFATLSDELEKRAILKQKIIGAILYPACITLGMLILVIVLMTAVFPKMIGIFSSLHISLPFSTRLLIGISGFLRHFGLLSGVVLLVATILCITFYNRTEKFHLFIDGIALQMPVFSKILRVYTLSSISNVIGLLMLNSLSLVDALTVATEACFNHKYKNVLKSVISDVSGGTSLSQSLSKYPKLFCQEYCDILSVGEQTGKLSETFAYTHALYERDLDVITKSLSASIEPILMIFIGLAIGMVAVSIVTPMYSITSHLHG